MTCEVDYYEVPMLRDMRQWVADIRGGNIHIIIRGTRRRDVRRDAERLASKLGWTLI